MPPQKNVQDTHISQQLPILHDALVSIVSVMNSPHRDEEMIRQAGIRLDRALFPLLIGVAKLGPIGVGDLADRVGRDYTTVSRQVAKLDSLGLVERAASEKDARVRVASITSKGRAMTDAIDRARDAKARALFASWSAEDFDNLVRLMQRLASGIGNMKPSSSREEAGQR
jgi:DNA-binding MarR family transcriptional regulator